MCIYGEKPSSVQETKFIAILTSNAPSFSDVNPRTINYYRNERDELTRVMYKVRRAKSDMMSYLYSLEYKNGKYTSNNQKYENAKSHNDEEYVYSMWTINGSIKKKEQVQSGPYYSEPQIYTQN